MKILLVNQSSVLKTGYGIFGKWLLSNLSKKYEVAEIACDIRSDDIRLQEIPWKVWGNIPTNDEERKIFEQNQLSIFGANIFEKVCLEYRPTHVISINDPWAASWIGKHPYKKHFNFIWMPTVDAAGLGKDWIYEFSLADKILTYQNWSTKVLKLESGKIVSCGEAPYIPEDFFPIKERQKYKEHLGLDGFVIGTTMRNQARKRFPELFAAFSKLLKKYPKTKLYCHCSYPDLQGWDIPQLLLKFGISNNVYFSYICASCGELWPSLFNYSTYCVKCKNRSGIMCNGNLSMPVDKLNIMYNCFDLYVQPVNAEGLGMPLLEAGACGTPVIGTNYASLKDVIPKLNGELFDSELQQEISTNRWMASVSINNLYEKLDEIMQYSPSKMESWRKRTREAFTNNYKRENSIKIWEETIESCQPKSWNIPKNIKGIPEWNDNLERISNADFVRWCIINILQDESKINTLFETKLVTELETRIRGNQRVPQLDKKMIFNELVNMKNQENYLDYIR